MPAPAPGGPLGDGAFARRAFIAAAAAVAAALAFVLLIRVTVPLVLLFAGLLLSVFFRALAEPIARRTGLSSAVSVAIVVLALLGAAALFGWLAGPALGEQLAELRRSLPEAFSELRARIARYEWGRALIGEADVQAMAENGSVIERATGIASRTVRALMSALGGILLVFFLAVFVAAEPAYYRRGLLRLVPPARRARVGEVLGRVDHVLRWWLLGRAISMAAVGVLVWIGLTLLDVPLALAFGLLAALFDFIPYFGPILAAVPAVLLAFVEGPRQALLVAGLYVLVQGVENWLIGPLVERNVVRLPPALTLAAQVLLGVAAGIVGAAFASPIVAAAMALVNAVWVERMAAPTDEGAR